MNPRELLEHLLAFVARLTPEAPRTEKQRAEAVFALKITEELLDCRDAVVACERLGISPTTTLEQARRLVELNPDVVSSLTH